jgi:hypothetical protein
MDFENEKRKRNEKRIAHRQQMGEQTTAKNGLLLLPEHKTFSMCAAALAQKCFKSLEMLKICTFFTWMSAENGWN